MMEDIQLFSSCRNILIEESKSYNLTTLILSLRDKGYNVQCIKNYNLAPELVINFCPDIILLDGTKVDSDEYNFCQTIRSNKKLMDIPVIFIISDFSITQRKKIYASGGNDYVVLPINYSELFSRVESQLKIRFIQLNINFHRTEELILENMSLKESLKQRTTQLDEITTELKDFNVMLEEEITERTKTEEALKESERQFRYAIEESPVPMMLYADDGEILKLSRAWINITGYTMTDTPTLFHLIENSKIIIENLELKEDHTLLNFELIGHEKEYTFRTKNGDERIWHMFSSFIGKLQDHRKLFSVVAIDVTEKKRIEELQKSVEEKRKKLAEIKEYDRIKTEFFSNISHELRTPINVIFSALQIFELKLKDCTCEKSFVNRNRYTKIMRQNCYRLLRLINNLIDITKIDSGYYDITKKNVDIVNLVEDITLSVADYIENKGITLIFDTNIEEKIIACDPEKIERIILNLLSNAVKFTPINGEIIVNIESDTDNICISVKDTGRGIPEDKLNSIFDRFTQVDKSLARDHEGSGIGLSLVKCLVELHDGTISVNSKENSGTEFNVYIPFTLTDEIEKENIIGQSSTSNYIEKINVEFSDIYN